jgi:hypothetical protein
MAFCKLCNKKLADRNKSHYCYKCYTKSPFYKEYQAEKQREYYAIPENREKIRKQRQKPEVKARNRLLQKRWWDAHKERVRELKRNWARKNRGKK